MTDTNNTDGAALFPVTKAMLPCPFCGADAVAPTHDDEFEAWRCGCSMCNGHTWADTEAEAVSAWNTRAPLPTTQEDAERAGVGAPVAWRVDDLTSKGQICDSFVIFTDYEKVEQYIERQGVRFTKVTALYALSASPPTQRQEYDGEAVREALAGLEWTEDGYSLRTPYDGDVDGDGRHVVVGGEVVVTFADSEIGDEYRERIRAALRPQEGEVSSG